jgi:hypothetical protein
VERVSEIQDAAIYGMVEESWEVEVFGGRPIDLTDPVKFGAPSVTVGEDGLTDPTVPVIYGPVAVRTVGNWAAIETSNIKTGVEANAEMAEKGSTSLGPRQVREMDLITGWEIDAWGEIRIEGMEKREDGALVLVRWLVRPYSPPVEHCSSCGDPKDWHTRFNNDDAFAAPGKGACIRTYNGGCDCEIYQP